MPQSALADLRVIDCTHVIAGAYCSMLLADLGADVIKVEPLGGEGDRINSDRVFRPFEMANRNKRAIAVDIRRPEGADIIRRLAKTADVFVENFRPGVYDKLGLGYDDLKTENPGLIYCSISGFGHSGPYRERGGFDLVAQAMSGITSFTGEIGSTRPVAAGVPLSDLSAGCFGALGILAALNHRCTTGVGQKVESTLLESALGYALWETGLFLATGEVANLPAHTAAWLQNSNYFRKNSSMVFEKIGNRRRFLVFLSHAIGRRCHNQINRSVGQCCQKKFGTDIE